jgi:chemosensory pili system protein ChpA (sensor histidine kinase/response regulator)
MNRKSVLVVEDSRVQALSLINLLKTYNLDVLWAMDGEMGITIAQEQKPDAILLDIEMPKMNGLEAYEVLQESDVTQNIPVLMMTSTQDQSLIFQGMSMEVMDFIPKDAFFEAVLLGTLEQLNILTAVAG